MRLLLRCRVSIFALFAASFRLFCSCPSAACLGFFLSATGKPIEVSNAVGGRRVAPRLQIATVDKVHNFGASFTLSGRHWLGTLRGRGGSGRSAVQAVCPLWNHNSLTILQLRHTHTHAGSTLTRLIAHRSATTKGQLSLPRPPPTTTTTVARGVMNVF